MKRIVNSWIFTIFTLVFLAFPTYAADFLVPVGRVVGLEIAQGSVIVAAFDDAFPVAKNAGIHVGDQISAIDANPVTCVEDLRKMLNRSDGTVELTVIRDGKEKTIRLSPEISSDGPKLGVYLRQGITGIGTVTYYDPDTGRFGALGHGVNDGKGKLLNLVRGHAYPATILSVQKGKVGQPGQLKGQLQADHLLGTLLQNTSSGVFGIAPEGWSENAVEVASFEEIHSGPAIIRSTVTQGEPQDYSVEILKIYPRSRNDGRNLLIKVTDPALLETTGGIVQGMSGSPIIQDGKLIGAVTHVCVNL